LFAAIAAGPNRQIALALVQWSSRGQQDITLPWRLLAASLDLAAAARDVKTAERRWRPGGTGLADAMDFSAALLAALPIVSTRRVIDVSGDGEDNEAGRPARARDDAVAAGIVVNGLPIISGSVGLERYYRQQVIGGPGCFVTPAETIMSFEQAMTRKLLREVQGPAIL
jgi:hypothetical protein